MGAREKGQGGRVVGRAREGGGLGWRAKDGGQAKDGGGLGRRASE